MWIKNVDLISEMNYIYFKNRKNHPSTFAGVLTILCYFAIVVFTVYFSIDVFLKKNPTSYFYKKFIPDAGIFYFNTSSIFHYLSLQTPDDKVRIDPDSFVIIGTETYIDTFLEKVDYSQLDYYVYELCTMKDIKGFESIMTDEQFEESVCIRQFYNKTTKKIHHTDEPDFPYPAIKHGTGSTDPLKSNVGYGAYVAYCDPTMPHRTKPCKSKKEILEEKENILRVKFTMIDNDFDVSIYKKPVVSYFMNQKNHLTGDTITNNNLNFNPVLINTDDGLIFKTNKKKTSYRFDLVEKITYTKTEDTSVISCFFFFMGNRQETYDRTYPKFQEALASVGGVSKAILMAAQIINYFINQYIILQDIQNMCETLGIDYSKKEKPKATNFNHATQNPGTNFNNNVNTNKSEVASRSSNNNLSNNILASKENMSKNNFLLKSTARNNTPGGNPPQGTFLIQNYMTRENGKKTKKKKYFKISLGDFLKSFISRNKNKAKTSIDLMFNFWRSKVSEESMVKLHLHVQQLEDFNLASKVDLKNNMKFNDYIKDNYEKNYNF